MKEFDTKLLTLSIILKKYNPINSKVDECSKYFDV
jgi:hypothetical protein